MRRIIIWTLFLWLGMLMSFIRPFTFGENGSGNSNSNKSAAGFYTGFTSETQPSGVLVLAIFGIDNIGSGTDGDKGDITAVTDDWGHTFSKAIEFSNVQTGAASGATVSIWYCLITQAYLASTGITASFNGGTNVTAKTFLYHAFTVAPGNTIQVAGTTTLAGDGIDPANITLSGVASQEYLWIWACALEAPFTGATIPAGWTSLVELNTFNTGTTGAGAASNMELLCGYQIATATSKSANVASGTTGDHAQVMVAFREITPASPTRRVYRIN